MIDQLWAWAAQTFYAVGGPGWHDKLVLGGVTAIAFILAAIGLSVVVLGIRSLR